MSLDVFQQVFSLSLIANSGVVNLGSRTQLWNNLQSSLASSLPGVGPDWQIVWGPVIWQVAEISAPDNTWFVAYHPRLQFEDGSVCPTYVVVIAGTAIASIHAWLKQNWGVYSVTDFKAWVNGGIHNPPVRAQRIVPGGAYIAGGTVDAVHTLLTTAPASNGAASTGKTLLEFIAHVQAYHTGVGKPPMFITTGHSLGGALSSSLGLALALGRHIPKDNILTYPSAGPSPGDVGFADLFSQTLPARKSPWAASYQGWNLNLNLDNILRISPLIMLPLMIPAVAAAVIASNIAGVKYKPLPGQYFNGTGPSNPVNMHVMDYVVEAGLTSK